MEVLALVRYGFGVVSHLRSETHNSGGNMRAIEEDQTSGQRLRPRAVWLRVLCPGCGSWYKIYTHIKTQRTTYQGQQ